MPVVSVASEDTLSSSPFHGTPPSGGVSSEAALAWDTSSGLALLAVTARLPPMALLEELETFSDERFLSIYESLTEKGFGPLDAQVAKALRFRPQSIRKVPLDRRARQARRLLEGPNKDEPDDGTGGTFDPNSGSDPDKAT